jgi:hypothetical protein
MPYALRIAKPVAITDRAQYINECCVGGDIVLDRLLPRIRATYTGLQTNQEDWGWFAWFEQSGVRLAVDVFTDDPETGEFQIHLTSRRPRFLLGAKIADTPELEALKALVVGELQAWPVSRLEIERVDDQYNPLDDERG